MQAQPNTEKEEKIPWLRTQLPSMVITLLTIQRKTQQARSEASREKPRFREAHFGRVHTNTIQKVRIIVRGTCPSQSPQRASLLRVEMVHHASQRSASTSLCTSPPHPSAQVPGPPGNSFPETKLPGGKESGEGTRAPLTVERKTAWCQL